MDLPRVLTIAGFILCHIIELNLYLWREVYRKPSGTRSFSNFYFDKHSGSGKPGSMTHSDDREVNLTNGRPLMPIKNVSMVKYFETLSIHYKMIFQP